MPCCFFHQFACRFREYQSQNIEESLNGVQQSETKGNVYINLLLLSSTWYVAQVINTRACVFFGRMSKINNNVINKRRIS